jgi:hypothetical protein
VYAIVNDNQEGWTSGQTLGLLAAATALFAVFLTIEGRVRSPLMPLRIFRLRNVATANVVGILWSAAMFAWFFLSRTVLTGSMLGLTMRVWKASSSLLLRCRFCPSGGGCLVGEPPHVGVLARRGKQAVEAV